jgi:hypothetical protein
MVPDARARSSMKNEQKYPRLYDSVISKLLNDLLITSALNPTCLLQSALNPTCLLEVSDFPTHLSLGPGALIIGLNDILFNQSIICRKVLFSMHYVIFR